MFMVINAIVGDTSWLFPIPLNLVKGVLR